MQKKESIRDLNLTWVQEGARPAYLDKDFSEFDETKFPDVRSVHHKTSRYYFRKDNNKVAALLGRETLSSKAKGQILGYLCPTEFSERKGETTVDYFLQWMVDGRVVFGERINGTSWKPDVEAKLQILQKAMKGKVSYRVEKVTRTTKREFVDLS
jgi:hypothetical protein